jgi:hypothetical protein
MKPNKKLCDWNCLSKTCSEDSIGDFVYYTCDGCSRYQNGVTNELLEQLKELKQVKQEVKNGN